MAFSCDTFGWNARFLCETCVSWTQKSWEWCKILGILHDYSKDAIDVIKTPITDRRRHMTEALLPPCSPVWSGTMWGINDAQMRIWSTWQSNQQYISFTNHNRFMINTFCSYKLIFKWNMFIFCLINNINMISQYLKYNSFNFDIFH